MVGSGPGPVRHPAAAHGGDRPLHRGRHAGGVGTVSLASRRPVGLFLMALALALAVYPAAGLAQSGTEARPMDAGAQPRPMDDTAPFADAALESRYRALTRELRCLVCQNETIADSQASLAVDLRREIRGMLAAGWSDGRIRTFMTDRYGDFVLYRPPLNAATLVLWLGPLVLLVLAVWLLRRRLRGVQEAPEVALEEADRQRVERWLKDGA